jgi:hypothetical protein
MEFQHEAPFACMCVGLHKDDDDDANGLQCKLYMCLGINLMKIDITMDGLE